MKSSSKALIWVILTFAAGSVLGTALTLAVLRPFRTLGREMDRPMWSERVGGQRHQERRVLNRMLRALELDAEQEAAVRRLLEESRHQLEEVERSRRQELRAVRRRTLSEIRTLLRPDQQERLDQFLRRLKQRKR